MCSQPLALAVVPGAGGRGGSNGGTHWHHATGRIWSETGFNPKGRPLSPAYIRNTFWYTFISMTITSALPQFLIVRKLLDK